VGKFCCCGFHPLFRENESLYHEKGKMCGGRTFVCGGSKIVPHGRGFRAAFGVFVPFPGLTLFALACVQQLHDFIKFWRKNNFGSAIDGSPFGRAVRCLGRIFSFARRG